MDPDRSLHRPRHPRPPGTDRPSPTGLRPVGLGQETVRLIGIDTPESVHPTQPDECYGPEAAAFTKSLLPAGTPVQLELDAEPRDRYGRLLAYVWVGEELVQNWYMINQKLVQNGYAEPLRIAPNVRYAEAFERLAGEAQTEGVGLWGVCR